MSIDDGSVPLRFVGVGIGLYDHYPELPTAGQEVADVAAELVKRGAVGEVLEAGRESEYLDALQSALLSGQDVDGGALVLFWAGHGEALPEGLRFVGPNGLKGGAPILTAALVASIAARSGASQILLIFDTCFSGGGVLPALVTVDAVTAERVDDQGRMWLGVLASAMDWERAGDDLFGPRLVRLLRNGPSSVEQRLRWDPRNKYVSGDDLIQALLSEWAESAPQRPKTAQVGWYRARVLPNPLHDPAAQPEVVEHLLLAAHGGEAGDERWYFSGREEQVGRVVAWIGSDHPGIHVVTGPAGSGKSAVLGLVVCLSDRVQREQFLEMGPLRYADPGLGSVHAHVYARGLAKGQLVREIDIQLSNAGVIPGDRRGQRGAGELTDAVESSGRRLVLVVDGLDEAGAEAWDIAAEVLRPLARHALVVVGTRDLPPAEDGPGLVATLQPDDAEVLRMPAAVDDDEDVRAYLLARLSGTPGDPSSDFGMDAELVAAAFLALPRHADEGLFLLARLVTARLLADPVDTSVPGWEDQLSASVEDALIRELGALPARERDGVELPAAAAELLAALAYALGAGLPDDLWPIVASAMSGSGSGVGNRYDEADAYWALAAGGRLIVVDAEANRAVYRLAHQRLAQHFRARNTGPDRNPAERDPDESKFAIAEALVDRYLQLLNSGAGPEEHDYLWRYTWRHCADAGLRGLELLGRLVEHDRNAFLPDLASAAHYVADALVASNQPDAAVAPAAQAAATYRVLAEENATYLPSLASALDSLGNCYTELGRHDQALPIAEEAVTLYRPLAEQNTGYLPYLAGVLTNLGSRYANLGRDDQALTAAEQAVTLYRPLAEQNPGYISNLAGALNNLGIRYAGLGRHDQALTAAEEAVGLYRPLAGQNPGYRPALASALTNLGNRYAQLGRHDQALTTTEEAVILYRPLADKNPGFLLDLARALNNLGNCYFDLGLHDQALAAAEEAVILYRPLAEQNPGYLRELAGALTNLGNRYAQLGRHDHALTTTEEAVTLYRPLAQQNPGYQPDLASALTNLGIRYAQLGRHDQALTTTEEAVDLYRPLAAQNPGYQPDLASALTNLGIRHANLGRHDQALPAAEEAVDLYRPLAEQNPGYLASLAGVLSNLGVLYAELRRHGPALATAEEALTLYRPLAEQNPGYLPDLASALNNLGIRYAQLGRHGQALNATQKAVTLRRSLAERNPGCLPDLASALNNLGSRYAELGRHGQALTAAEEAVAVYRPLTEQNPGYLRSLARALNNLSNRYAQLGRRGQALTAAEEAVTLYRPLAEQNPGYLTELARALANLGVRYAELGRADQALTATEDAVTLYRSLAERNPGYLSYLASGLDNLGILYTWLDRHDEALTATEEAAAIRRGGFA